MTIPEAQRAWSEFQLAEGARLTSKTCNNPWRWFLKWSLGFQRRTQAISWQLWWWQSLLWHFVFVGRLRCPGWPKRHVCLLGWKLGKVVHWGGWNSPITGFGDTGVQHTALVDLRGCRQRRFDPWHPLANSGGQSFAFGRFHHRVH